MIELNASLNVIISDAGTLTDQQLQRAITVIDRHFEQPGAAEEHPELIKAYMLALAVNTSGAMNAAVLQAGLRDISYDLRQAAEVLRKYLRERQRQQAE